MNFIYYFFFPVSAILFLTLLIFVFFSIKKEKDLKLAGTKVRAKVLGLLYYDETLKKCIISNKYITGGRLVLSFKDLNQVEHIVVEQDYCVSGNRYGMHRCPAGSPILNFPRYKAGQEIDIIYQETSKESLVNKISRLPVGPYINFEANDIIEVEGSTPIIITNSIFDYDIIYTDEPEESHTNKKNSTFKLVFLIYGLAILGGLLALSQCF